MYVQVLFLLTAATLVTSQLGQFRRKPGECPPLPNVRVCEMTCFADGQCIGGEKCCRTACGGTFCITPVTPKVAEVEEKPGTCPDPPTGPWVCSSRCSSDPDCRGQKKCCKNRCGALACVLPSELVLNEE